MTINKNNKTNQTNQNREKCSVSAKMAWRWSTPRWLRAAHRVTFPRRWPGTFTTAWWPIMFLPLLLLLLRLKPASCSWGTGRPSVSKILSKTHNTKSLPWTAVQECTNAVMEHNSSYNSFSTLSEFHSSITTVKSMKQRCVITKWIWTLTLSSSPSSHFYLFQAPPFEHITSCHLHFPRWMFVICL